VTLGKEVTLCRVPPNTLVTECILFRVSACQHSANNPSAGPHVRFFAECCVGHLAKRASLPSARATALGKEPIPMPRSWFFVESYDPDTQQSTSLPSVTLSKVTSTHLFYLFFLFYQTNKRYITDITYIHHKYHIYTSQISSQTLISNTNINIQVLNTNSINTSSEVSTRKSQALT
jgi:hypothetical protein